MRINRLPLGYDTTGLIQKYITNLLIAENDYTQYSIKLDMFKINTYFQVKLCYLFNIQLKALSNLQDHLEEITDTNGNSLIIYSKNNIIFLPVCTKLDQIELVKSDECFEDLPIVATVDNTKYNLFLTSNNFVKGYSRKVDCSLVNSRQLLPSKKQIIARFQNNVTILNVSNLIFQELAQNRLNLSEINFFHHAEIIQGYDYFKQFYDFEKWNDLEGHFYDFPNDDTSTDAIYKEDILNFKQSMDNHLTNIFFYISIIKWIYFISVFLIVFLIIYYLWKFLNTHIFGLSRRNFRNDLLSLNDLAARYLLRHSVDSQRNFTDSLHN